MRGTCDHLNPVAFACGRVPSKRFAHHSFVIQVSLLALNSRTSWVCARAPESPLSWRMRALGMAAGLVEFDGNWGRGEPRTSAGAATGVRTVSLDLCPPSPAFRQMAPASVLIARRRVSLRWFKRHHPDRSPCGAALIGGAFFASLDGEMSCQGPERPGRASGRIRGANDHNLKQSDRLPPLARRPVARKRGAFFDGLPRRNRDVMRCAFISCISGKFVDDYQPISAPRPRAFTAQAHAE